MAMPEIFRNPDARPQFALQVAIRLLERSFPERAPWPRPKLHLLSREGIHLAWKQHKLPWQSSWVPGAFTTFDGGIYVQYKQEFGLWVHELLHLRSQWSPLFDVPEALNEGVTDALMLELSRRYGFPATCSYPQEVSLVTPWLTEVGARNKLLDYFFENIRPDEHFEEALWIKFFLWRRKRRATGR